MKKNRIIKFIVFMVLIGFIFILYKYHSPDTAESMSPLPHEPIILGQGEKLHFYKDGFAISGESNRFYDTSGNPTTPPFSDDIDSTEQSLINMSSSNFMLIGDRWIYDTSNTPFEKIYELDPSIGAGRSIQEFSNCIMVLIEDENNILIPKLLNLDNKTLLDLKDIEPLYYMDSDYDSENASLSILALNLDASFPSSKVLNYSDGTTLFSVISTTDEIYYKILRLTSHIVLVGNHEIICYNIDGTLQWSIKNKEIKDHKILETENGFIFYFSYSIDNGDGIFFNALEINSDGSYKKLDFPYDLVDLQPYGSDFIGLRYGSDVLIINKNGSIKNEFYVSGDMVDLYYSKYHENNLYLLDRENQLYIYSTKQEDSVE